uniref:Uncharacterized protein n=1 Tax=Arundo donax TaxID=35708 RepID=A0A0A9D054_ARUDO
MNLILEVEANYHPILILTFSLASSRLVNHFLACTGGSIIVIIGFQKTIFHTIS